jgi:hypothetical protein
MSWFNKKSRKNAKPNEYAGFLFDENGTQINSDDIIIFPVRDKVFISVSELIENVFFPLCSINMNLINPDWHFFGHFVYVFREQEENKKLSKYYTEYCGDYSLGFDLVNGKYDLQAKEDMLTVSDRYNKYLLKAKDKYLRFLKDYYENGLDNLIPLNKDFNFLVKRLAGEPMWVQKDETPKDFKGGDLLFVGQLRVLDFIAEGQYLYLFYSPEYDYFVQIEQYH